MKNSEIASAIIGTTFFAIPYLAGLTTVVPAIAIGGAAFIAGELVLRKDQIKTLKEINFNLYETLENAKKRNKRIINMIDMVDNVSIKGDLQEITKNINKIIKTIETEPDKIKKIKNLFDYYLPATEKIVNRYDQIENQNISSKESKSFVETTEKEIKKLNEVFKEFLNSLYLSDMTDAKIEMKVLNSMLKADGIEKSEFEVKESKDE